MSERCIVCGKPATVSAQVKSRNGSTVTANFCNKHERGRIKGRRRTKKAINKGIRSAFK